MRKTPLSAPGGSYNRKNNYDWNSRDRHAQGYDDRDSGYGRHVQNDNKQGCFSPGQNQTPSPQKIGDDFIPLGFSSPVNNQRPSYNNHGNWRGHPNTHRYRGTPPSPGGFNNSYRRNFHHDTPKSSFNDSNSQRFHQKHHFGPRRPYQKDAHRQVNISNYLNVQSTLEDPWADLVENLEKRNAENGIKVETPDSNTGASSCGDGNVKSDSTDLDSVLQKSETTVDEKPETTPTVITVAITNTSS